MTTSELLQMKLIDIIDVARLAPSVHNTQPWLVRVNGAKLEISIDSRHMLSDGDPTGRETIISLGIFTEAICIGAATIGLRPVKVSFKARLVTISFGISGTGKPDAKSVDLLRNRCTDRSIYQPAVISKETILSITAARKHKGVTISVVTEQSLLKTIANLTSKGIRLAISSPDFRKELSKYLVIPGSTKKRGIATRSLYLFWVLELMEPWLMRAGIGLDAEAKLEKRRWQSASAAVVITTDGDMADSWFEAGRSYLQASLAIERKGLSQATSAAIVEASTFHEDIESLLGTTQRIQCIIRIGQGSKNRHYSPRVSANELIAT